MGGGQSCGQVCRLSHNKNGGDGGPGEGMVGGDGLGEGINSLLWRRYL